VYEIRRRQRDRLGVWPKGTMVVNYFGIISSRERVIGFILSELRRMALVPIMHLALYRLTRLSSASLEI